MGYDATNRLPAGTPRRAVVQALKDLGYRPIPGTAHGEFWLEPANHENLAGIWAGIGILMVPSRSHAHQDLGEPVGHGAPEPNDTRAAAAFWRIVQN